MPVYNLHTRRLPVPVRRVGALLDTLASADDRLWAGEHWPPMRFDRALGVGALGGHGPVRYRVIAYVPGQWVRFRFTAPHGFEGIHEFTAHQLDADTSRLDHLMAMRLRRSAWLTYPLLWRWLHDAALEDSLDRAEHELTGMLNTPARWNGYVRLLRRVMAKRPR